MSNSARLGVRMLAVMGSAAISVLAFQGALGQESQALPKGFKTTPVLKGGKTADGDTLAYPKTDKPEVV